MEQVYMFHDWNLPFHQAFWHLKVPVWFLISSSHLTFCLNEATP